MSSDRPRVVVIGAGFGGLWAARTLVKSPVDVLLIDRNNYHVFFPLLYQVAAAELEPEDIAYPVRNILRRRRNVDFLLADVTDVDLKARTLNAGGRTIPYDYLVLSTGSITSYFGVPGAADLAFPLRTLEQGIALRNHILSCFENAVHKPDPEHRQLLTTFAIVGGGPTGVEFAGALAELVRGPLRKDYRTLDFAQVKIILLEAGPALLPSLQSRLGAYAAKRLRGKAVDVRLGSVVTGVTPHSVLLKDGSTIPTDTVIWTAGVQGAPEAHRWGFPLTSGGRVAVQPTLQTPQHPSTYVIGDLADVKQDGRLLPMVAPVAIQQGVAAAKNILRQLKGGDPQPFKYKDLGTMAVIGRNAAVAHLFNRYALTGFLAWLIWLVVHLARLIGFRNRLIVLINWSWDYLFYERVVRLILPAESGGRRTRHRQK